MINCICHIHNNTRWLEVHDDDDLHDNGDECADISVFWPRMQELKQEIRHKTNYSFHLAHPAVFAYITC